MTSAQRPLYQSSIRLIFALAAILVGCSIPSTTLAATQLDIAGPVGSGLFGAEAKVLPNGNFVVTDYNYDITSPTTISNVGAVHLYNGRTGTLISTLTGSTANDQVGVNNADQPGVTVLANGNYVVRSFNWDNGSVVNAGAVTFCSGTTGCSGVVSSMNSLVGSQTNDFVGASAIDPLVNGNYLVTSFQWNNGPAVDAGAVTWCSGTTGCPTGEVSASNSLVGATNDDRIGSTVTQRLADGDYVVISPNWNGAAVDTGAATYCSGTAGCIGIVSATNSLVGSQANDRIATRGISELPNGNFVVQSPSWDNGSMDSAGAATLCSGSAGCTGAITSANSVVGVTAGENVGDDIAILSNGNWAVSSPNWDAVQTNVGAVRFCNGSGGCVGPLTAANSLIGSQGNDAVGNVTALTNGNYVVASPNWNSETQTDVGAATWCSGTTGCTGVVGPTNSVVGPNSNSQVGGGGIVALSNGNYVVRSPNWNGNSGAATFCIGSALCTGTVSSTNSLAGSSGHQIAGLGVLALPNGNYVVVSPRWDNGATLDVGAVTWCSGTAGCIGAVTTSNSLVGTQTTDLVGGNQSNLNFVLANGDYIVHSPFWNNGATADVGAVTRCSGSGGCVGTVSPANSVVGSTANDRLQSARGLADGNYAVFNPFWDSPTAVDVGAVRWCSSSAGCNGTMTEQNSLVGTTTNDNIGNSLSALPTGDYVVASQSWDNGTLVNAGAVTFGKRNGTTTGPITEDNSVRGDVANPITSFTSRFALDQVNGQLVVGRPAENIVTLFRTRAAPALFDFDGDGRSDISVFRPMPDPADNFWYIQQSSTGNTVSMEWGIQADRLAPADYDGDGKADIAVWRDEPSNPDKASFYIMQSSNNAVRIEQFGRTGDTPTIAGDWDGDGKADPAVYRSGTGGGQSFFFYRPSSQPGTDFTTTNWGVGGDTPMRGDYDGDGKLDAAVFRSGDNTWYIRQSSNGEARYDKWGVASDKFVPADYDGDGKTDLAVFRDGTWYITQSSNNVSIYQAFGLATDQLVPGDYDGDGRADLALFRAGIWYVLQSQSGSVEYTRFGSSGDRAVPSVFQP